jgi:hypothetical protein
MKCYSIFALLLALLAACAVSKGEEERKDWPSAVRYYGVERDFAGLSIGMSASYAAIGAPAGRIFGCVAILESVFLFKFPKQTDFFLVKTRLPALFF